MRSSPESYGIGRTKDTSIRVPKARSFFKEFSIFFQNGGTALMYAVFGGFADIVKKLLGLLSSLEFNEFIQYHMDVKTTFHFSLCIELIAESGADMTVKNENDDTCYSLASSLGNKAGCVFVVGLLMQ